jgi:lysophospholipase L1-like esterase
MAPVLMASGRHSSVHQRLFVLGDSISLHYGLYLEKSLGQSWRYERKPGRTENTDRDSGPNGGDSFKVLEYLRKRRESAGIATDWLLFNCGLHDIKRDPVTGQVQVEREAYEKNLEQIIAIIRDLHVRPVWVRTTPVLESLHNVVPRQKAFNRFMKDVGAYNASADSIMAAAAVPTIDLFRFTETLMPAGTYDGVHFTDDVRQRQGEFVARALRALAVQDPSAGR